MEGFFGKGYKFFVDNWYISEELFFYFYENNIVVCGIVRKNRLKLLVFFKIFWLVKGEYVFRRKDDMLVVWLNDKKEIYFLFIMYEVNVVDIGKRDRYGNNVRKL